jgi:hypothetical protein
MKGSDFFKKLNETLGITIPEETLTKLGEIDLPDDLQAKHAEVFISKERAKHDESIIEHIVKEDRKNNFRIMDEKIKQFLPLIGQDQATVIGNTFETFKKMDILTTAVGDAIKASKGKVSEDVRKVEEEWAAKVKAKEEDFAKQLSERDEKNKQMQLEFVIKSKLLGYNFAEPFQNVKDHLTQMAIIDLKSKPYIYELENGSVAIRQEKDGVKRDVFEQGTENKLTLEKMLDSFVDPFIAKSNGKTETKKDDSGTTPPKQINSGQPVTLRDRMLSEVKV